MVKVFDLTEYPKVKAFSQHGFTPRKTSGDKNIQGDCPLCGEEMEFYVNHESRQWVCDGCHRQGNFPTFLGEIAEANAKELKGEPLVKLAKNRGLLKATLRRRKVGWNPTMGHYTIPIFHHSGKSLIDLRIYKLGKNIRSSLGGGAGLAGIEDVLKDVYNKEIWLCEGQWDWLVADEIIYECKLDVIAVGVPGAGVFKTEWQTTFRGRKVTAIYDKDAPGIEGEAKAFNKIASLTESMRYVRWEDDRPDGFDLRDFYLQKNACDPERTYRRLLKLLKDKPREMRDEKNKLVGTKEMEYTGKGLDIRQALDVYKKWLYDVDTDAIEMTFATCIANRMEGDPVWLFLVGPPGCGKTEILMSLTNAIRITTTSSITPHVLVSGFGGGNRQDPSLIPKLNGRVLVIKDFTAILNMPYQDRDLIFGTLRDAFDGKFEKFFGNDVGFRGYNSKFGVIAGVTPAIDRALSEHSALGPRFVNWRIYPPRDLSGARGMLRKSMDNSRRKVAMREELNNTAKAVLNYDFKTIPDIPIDIQNRIVDLSYWLAVTRGSVHREKYTGDIDAKPIVEVATRIATQFTETIQSVGMLRRIPVVGESEFQLLIRLAKNTLYELTNDVLGVIFQKGRERGWTSREVSVLVNLPSAVCTKVLDDLVALRIMVRRSDEVSFSKEYYIRGEMLELMKSLNIYNGGRHAKKKKKKVHA